MAVSSSDVASPGSPPPEVVEFALTRSPTVFYSAVLDGAARLTYVARNAAREIGCSPSALLAEGALAHRVHREDRAGYRRSLEALARSGRMRCSYRLRDDDGRFRYVTDEAHVDVREQPVRIVGFLLRQSEPEPDPEPAHATDTRRLELAVAEGERLHRLLVEALESSPSAFGILDAEGTLTLCNRAFAEPLDQSPAALVGSTRRDRVRKVLASVVRVDDRPITGGEEDVEWWMNRMTPGAPPAEVALANGKWLLVNVSPMPDGGAAVIRTDITSLKRARREAERFSRLLHDALESIPNAFGVSDSRGYLLLCNRSYAEIYGESPDALVGLSRMERTRRFLRKVASIDGRPIDGSEADARWWHERLAGVDAVPAEVQLRDGQWRLVSATPVVDGGFAVLRTDITRLKNAEQESQRLNQLLNDAIESIPNDFAIIAPDGRLVLCNAAYASIYDAMPSELMAKPRVSRSEQFLSKVATIDGHPVEGMPDAAREWRDRLRRGDAAEVELKSGEWKLVTSSALSDGGFAIIRTDITKLKTAQLTLRASELRYRTLVEHAPILICELDLDGRCRSMNAKGFELSDTEPGSGEIIGRHIVDLVPEADRERVRALWDEAVSGRAVEFENCLRRQGRPVTLASSFVPVKDSAGNVERVVGIASDISAIRRREEDLRLARETLEDAIESLSEGVALYDRDDRLLLCNERYREFSAKCREMAVPGVSWETLLRAAFERGQFPDIVGDQQRQEAMAAMRAVAGGYAELRQWDGRWLAYSNQRTRQGGTVTSVTDVTHRKKMEEALREREALVRQVLEACPVPLRMSRLRDGRILYDNPATTTLFGALPPEKAQWARNYYVREADRGPVMDALRKAGKIDHYELELKRADGTTFPAALSCRLIEHQGEEVNVSSTQDLTERRAMEQEMSRQRDALHQSEKLSALFELLASVSHELNNPLSVVVWQALLLDETAEDPRIVERARKIAGAADRRSRIVKTFLAMARQQPGDRTSLDVNELIETALALAAESLQSTGISVSVRLSGNLPAIRGDRAQMGQVLTNLLVNAHHALQCIEGARRLAISSAYREDLERVVIEVKDNGPGVPESIRSRIFEPFFTTKEVGAGTGIGLSICHRIVEGHGGTIRLDTTPGGGATFTILLPVVGSEGSRGERTERSEVRSGPLASLVVDDEPEVADSLADMLRLDGHEVAVTYSGDSALTRLSGQAFDVLLSDIRMPDLDGPKLCQALERVRPELVDRVVFVTGDTMSAHVQQFLISSGRPYLEKPVRPEEIRRLLRSLEIAPSRR